MKLSSPIYKLKRQAKLLARGRDMQLHQALNTIAKTEGFRDWGHLASRYDKQSAKATPADGILQQICPGDMVLVGARAGHGKTLLGLKLAALAGRINRRGYFFTLDYNETDVCERLKALGFDPDLGDHPVTVDTSDKICATYIIDSLADTAGDALVIVDYLQILDQRRTTPPLDEQVGMLKAFAREQGAIIVMISQIDRSFDLSAKPMPCLDDIRLPNQIDLSLFDRQCFLHHGAVRIERVA
jgi:replicative DNA helicase